MIRRIVKTACIVPLIVFLICLLLVESHVIEDIRIQGILDQWIVNALEVVMVTVLVVSFIWFFYEFILNLMPPRKGNSGLLERSKNGKVQ